MSAYDSSSLSVKQNEMQNAWRDSPNAARSGITDDYIITDVFEKPTETTAK